MKRFWMPGTWLLLAACGPTDGGPDGATTTAEPDMRAAGAAVAEAPPDRSDAPAAATSAGTETGGAVLAQEFAYGASEERNLVGYFAMPEDVVEPLPGVVMIHEWRGLDEGVRAAARRLAAAGYAVLAIDLFGGIVIDDPAEGGRLTRDILRDREAALDNIRQAHDYLVQYALAPEVAVLGWSFGGTWALEAGIDLPGRFDAVVTYYGEIELSDSRLRQLDAPLLGLFAEHDPTIPLRDVQSFRTRLRDFGKDSEVLIYSDVAHAFASPGESAFDAGAASEAWGTMLEFLESRLGGAAVTSAGEGDSAEGSQAAAIAR